MTRRTPYQPGTNCASMRIVNRIIQRCRTGAVLACLSVLPLGPAAALSGAAERVFSAPEFSRTDAQSWINSEPLRIADLRGKVLLIDFWTFDCWNCYRSFPWLKAMEQRLETRGLQVIGIHSPEFEHERVRENVVQKVKEFGLHHPVMLDNDFAYWKAMGNRYWPAFYLIDKQGQVRKVFVGETHEGDARARQIETLIEALLAEAYS